MNYNTKTEMSHKIDKSLARVTENKEDSNN
jgi:hypothetical protein